ncbi:protein RADIALIS-like 4 isoform X2 [Gossypium australe]|uniref:Protein RADIALIS-like 4 isoform X2 n=1 Tax=Gossypium australe TaxID=47621 RepID=A0A5B6X809_9ROSI|nr:protein RADIALIS-like 4 isoform X2 [Gossypium australe]
MSGVLSRISSLSMPSLSFRKKPLIGGGRRSLTGFLESQPKKWKSIDMLLHDVYEIEAGRIEIHRYADDSSMSSSNWNSNNQIYFTSKSKHQLDNERKEGSPWTEEEHKVREKK